MRLLINIDVPDLERAIGFYEQAFGLTLTPPPGAGGGGNVRRPGPIYLLEKAAGTPAAGATRQPRDYARHWTPVHLDVVVDDVDAAVARAVAAGARLEDPAATHAWGRIAHLSDPFGHGICLLQFLGRGYDELAEPALRYPAVSEADFEDLLALRIAAMRESLERLGRFDPERARAAASHLPPGIHLGNRAGRKTRRLLRPAPGWRRPAPGPPVPAPIGPGPGPGRPHAQRLLAQADAQGLPLRVGALRDSDSNRFYQRHGFVQVDESEWDIEYLRPRRRKPGLTPPSRATAALPPRNAARPPPRTEQSRARGRSNEDQRHNPTRPPQSGPRDPAPPVRSRPLGKRAALRGLYVLGSVTPRWP